MNSRCACLNGIDSNQPLYTAISTDEESRPEVRDTGQRKTVRVASNGVGPTHMLAKYQMLNQPGPTSRGLTASS